MSRRMIALLGVLTSILLVVGILIGFITLYKDTQCTTVLGTQVCRSWHPAARPDSTPAPSTSTEQVGSFTVVWTFEPSGGRQTVLDCNQVQCVRPGYPIGPDGSTCQDVVNNQQVCSK